MKPIALLPWTRDDEGFQNYAPPLINQGLSWVTDRAREAMEMGFRRIVHRKPFGHADCHVGFRWDGNPQIGGQPDWQNPQGPYTISAILDTIELTRSMGFDEVIVYHGLPLWTRVMNSLARAHEWLAPYADRCFSFAGDQLLATWGPNRSPHPFVQAVLEVSGPMGVRIYGEPRMTAYKTTPLAGTVPAGTITQRSLVDPALATNDGERTRNEDRLTNGVGLGEWVEFLQPNDVASLPGESLGDRLAAGMRRAQAEGRTPCVPFIPLRGVSLDGVAL